MQAIKVYNLRQVDELVFLDITATRQGRRPDFSLVDDFADECFMPLTVGGGIRSVDDVRGLLKVGADKIAINTAAVENPNVIREIADQFGNQCIVVSIDVKFNQSKGIHTVFTHSGTRDTGINPVEFAQQMEALGAGEILLTSINLDGTMQGYDLNLLNNVSASVGIPIIASGGAGCYEHFVEALKIGNVAAVAAASIFHFTEQTPLEAKQYLKAAGFPTRQ